MTVQFVKTPAGEELAILPKAEYEKLAMLAAEVDEDDADVVLYDARKAAHSPALPPEVSAFMLRGDSLLRAVRKWKDMTQMHIEHKTGIGQGYLSDLEVGRRKGSPEVLAQLADALGVPREWFAPA